MKIEGRLVRRGRGPRRRQRRGKGKVLGIAIYAVDFIDTRQFYIILSRLIKI